MMLRYEMVLFPILVSLSFVATPATARSAEQDSGHRTVVLKSQKVEFPQENLKFRGDAAGAKAATDYCLMCHSRGMIDAQPPLSRDQWKTEVIKMRSTYGCPLSEGMDEELADFLFQYNHKPLAPHE